MSIGVKPSTRNTTENNHVPIPPHYPSITSFWGGVGDSFMSTSPVHDRMLTGWLVQAISCSS